MPLGEASKLPAERFVSHQQSIDRLGTRVAPEAALEGRSNPGARPPPVTSRRGMGSGRKVGFITAVSDKICDSCNRVRLTCTGTLYMCLGQEDAADLRAVLRDPAMSEDGPARRPSRRRSPASRRGMTSSSTAATASPAVARHMSVTGG